jgi:hypothetical protein
VDLEKGAKAVPKYDLEEDVRNKGKNDQTNDREKRNDTVHYRCLVSFKALVTGELSFNENEIVTRLCDGTGSEIRVRDMNGDEGTISSKYLKIIENVQDPILEKTDVGLLQKTLEELQLRVQQQEQILVSVQYFMSKFPSSTVHHSKSDGLWIQRKKHESGRELTKSEYDQLHTVVFAFVDNDGNVSRYYYSFVIV